jgi:hypothetical protein
MKNTMQAAELLRVVIVASVAGSQSRVTLLPPKR